MPVYGHYTTILAPHVDCSRARDTSDPSRALVSFIFSIFYLFMDCAILLPTEPPMKRRQFKVYYYYFFYFILLFILVQVYNASACTVNTTSTLAPRGSTHLRLEHATQSDGPLQQVSEYVMLLRISYLVSTEYFFRLFLSILVFLLKAVNWPSCLRVEVLFMFYALFEFSYF